MNICHPGQLEKRKSWGPFLSYQLNSTANPAHLPWKWAKWAHWQCCLAGSSKTAPRILIFSIAMGADYLFEVKNIEIWVPAFFKHNNLSVATVLTVELLVSLYCTVLHDEYFDLIFIFQPITSHLWNININCIVVISMYYCRAVLLLVGRYD